MSEAVTPFACAVMTLDPQSQLKGDVISLNVSLDSYVVNCRAALSSEFALRLAAALGVSAESWLILQLAYDFARAKTRHRSHIQGVLVKSALRKLENASGNRASPSVIPSGDPRLA